MAKYRLHSVEATTDGTGMVAHNLEGIEDDGTPVPGRHGTLMVPEADLDVVLAMPDATGAQKQAKNQAYKDLLVANAPEGWTKDELDNVVDANAEALAATNEVDDYVVNTLGQSYPVEFTL